MIRYAPWLASPALLLFAAEALARVGGGQSFGGGGGGGGGHSSGGGGGGGDLVFLLIELVIRYPRVGIPLVSIFIVFTVGTKLWEARNKRHVVGTHARPIRGRPARPQSVPGLTALKQRDRAFSMPVLKDYLVLVHRRALEAAVSNGWGPLTPFVEAKAQRALSEQLKGVAELDEVVVGSIAVEAVRSRGRYDLLPVRIDGTRRERRDRATRFRVAERWTFRRLKDAISLAPEAVQRMGCPSCGASVETSRMGACSNCDSPISAGQLQWQLVGTAIESRRAFEPPKVGLFAGGDEPSVHYPTVEAPDLAAQLRVLTSIHPDFDLQAFGQRATGIYHGLQDAWSHNKWTEARPWVTDPMYQSLRFWMEEYTANGLRNQLTDVKLTRLRVAKVGIDPWYESITIRIWGSMKDSVVDSSGAVVGGNPKKDRNFSEYWTFLRAAGSGSDIHDAMACPSCAAPLDKIGQAGECGYCGSVITTGRFDWVLSSIEQCEAYNGG